MLKYPVLALLVLGLSVSFAHPEEIAVDPKAPTYHNARFGFSISWTPGKYTVFEADNGDGITVTDGKGLTMLVYADLEPRVSNASREDFFAQANKKPKAEYRRINTKQNWYVLSYLEDGNIVYTKVFYHKDHWPTLYFKYPQSMKKKYDPLLKQALSSFRPF